MRILRSPGAPLAVVALLSMGLAPLAPPAVTGPAVAGGTLTCSPGTWEADPGTTLGFAFAWTRDGAAILGAGQPTLTTTTGGDYRCAVTASDDVGGSAQQTSAPFHVELAIDRPGPGGPGPGEHGPDPAPGTPVPDPTDPGPVDAPPGTPPPDAPAPRTPAPPAAFGTATRVTLALATGRPRRGHVLVRVLNANAFAVAGAMRVRTARRIARGGAMTIVLPPHATRTVALPLSALLRRALAHGRGLTLVASLTDPAGNRRVVSATARAARRGR